MCSLTTQVMVVTNYVGNMANFGGMFEYNHRYVEGGFIYYMKCTYAGHIYDSIKVNMDTGMCTLYTYDKQEYGCVPMKKM